MIVRSLRGRYISGEAELAAKAAMNRLEARGAPPPAAEKPFTEEEKARAKAFLAKVKSAYPKSQ